MNLLIPQGDGGEGFGISIEPGGRVLLIGPNGAGKSRLGAYIENELCNRIFHNISNIANPAESADGEEQQLIQFRQEIERLRNMPLEQLAIQIKDHQEIPFHPFIPGALNRREILDLYFAKKLPFVSVRFESNSFHGSIPPNSINEISGGQIIIAEVSIDVEVMKVDSKSTSSVSKFVESNISSLERKIQDLQYRRVGFKRVEVAGAAGADRIKFCLRISGHRSLVFNRVVSVEDPAVAQRNLIGDVANINQKWNGKPVGGLQADFDKLLIALVSDEVNAALSFKQGNDSTTKPKTKLDLVLESWNELLPHRRLRALGADVKITFDGGEYSLDQCSEGEKSIFYILGQCVIAPEGALIIIDEPDIHINKSILTALFDKVESTRSDCAFIYVTHDMDFCRNRVGAKSYIVKKYIHPNKWDICLADSFGDIPQEIVAKIAGSRNPVLFCEGDDQSLDVIYKKVYPDFTVVPVKSCGMVIGLVAGLNGAGVERLHHIDFYGIVDGDNKDRESGRLKQLKIGLLENVFLIPEVAEILYGIFVKDWPGRQEYINLVISWSTRNEEWRVKNIVDISQKHLESLISSAIKGQVGKSEWIESLDMSAVRRSIEEENSQWQECLREARGGDLFPLLRMHRGKGLMADLAKDLGVSGKRILLEKIKNINEVRFIDAVRRHLPNLIVGE